MLFTKILNSIDTELRPFYQPGAMSWSDKNLDNIWSRSIERFYTAVDLYQKSKDHDFIEAAALSYRDTIIDCIKQYKLECAMKDNELYLERLEKRDTLEYFDSAKNIRSFNQNKRKKV